MSCGLDDPDTFKSGCTSGKMAHCVIQWGYPPLSRAFGIQSIQVFHAEYSLVGYSAEIYSVKIPLWYKWLIFSDQGSVGRIINSET